MRQMQTIFSQFYCLELDGVLWGEARLRYFAVQTLHSIVVFACVNYLILKCAMNLLHDSISKCHSSSPAISVFPLTMYSPNCGYLYRRCSLWRRTSANRMSTNAVTMISIIIHCLAAVCVWCVHAYGQRNW